MVKKQKKGKKFISFMLVFILVLSNFAFATPNSKTEFKTFKKETTKLAKDKIHEDVRKALDKDGSAEVLVYFKNRINPERVVKLNSIGKTPYEQKLSSRNALINALKDKAETTQYNLIKYLNQQQQKGKVSEFESFYVVNIVYLKGTKEVIENIAHMDEVEKIYPNRKIKPIKPEKSKKPKALESSAKLEWNIEKVGANSAWNLGYDGTGAVVGIIDTGVDWTHEALKEKWRGYNPQDPDNPNPEGNWFDAVDGKDMPYDIPYVPHGTHVMGTILGQDPTGENKIGIAPGAKWIAAKAFDLFGGYDNWLLAAGEWMLAPGGDPSKAPDVINNSWGGDSSRDDWYRDMVSAWRAMGIVPVFSAGNESFGEAPPGSISNPANYPESFAVGATDNNNLRAYFSQRGPGPYGDDIKPEIVAPGVNIRSSVPGGYEDGWSGTSMSAPHVTGAVALLFSVNNSLTVKDVENIIEKTAIPLTDKDYSSSPNYGYGYGLLNVFDAVSEVSTGTGIIKGKVLVDGEDVEDPQIYHDPIEEDRYLGSDIPIKARITDDVSVVEAELMVKTIGTKHWYHIPMSRISGNVKDGIYKGEISSEIIEVPGFVYKIKVRDYDENIVYTDEYNVNVKFGIVPGEYETDFEKYPTGWTLKGDWEWGEPTLVPTPHSGTKVVGTVLDGKYKSNSDSLLITPAIDLRDKNLPSASLRLFHWYEVEDYYDMGQIYISNDYGKNWTPVGPKYTGKSEEWQGLFINLDKYIGSKDPVFVAFRFTSDFAYNESGWYIDDVKLVGEDIEPPTAPIDFIGEAKTMGASLEWSPSSAVDVQGYKIYRSEKAGGEYELIGNTVSEQYLDTKVKSNKTYYYTIKAYDFAGNESELSEEIEITVGTMDLVYFSNFENDNGNFNTDGINNCWEWGIPTSGPESVLSDGKVWATKLDGNYLRGSTCWIESPNISLPVEKNSVLYFNHWYDTGYWDGECQVHIIGEDGIWKNITPDESFYGKTNGWIETKLPLSEYAGQNIKIRFVFLSEQWAEEFPGWYIDSVAIAKAQSNEKLGKLKIYEIKEKSNTLKKLKKQNNIKKHTKPKKINYILKDKTKSPKNNFKMNVSYSAVPVDATVTVLETGRSVRTDLATGKFQLRHGANKPGQTWTLRAVAYGYYPQEVKVKLGSGAVIRQNFKLEPIPRGDIVGKIVDRFSGESVSNACIRVAEDTNVKPVYSDENGKFTIPKVLEGSYTLKVVADDYERGEITVKVIGNEVNEVEIPLKRFVGYEKEIVYDDGTAEDGMVLVESNNGVAIKVTPTQYGKVKGANVYFWGDDWPEPGGEEIRFVIFDTDEKGNPTKMVGEPKIVNIERGKWNYIDLSDFHFSTDRDFFIGTVQTKTGDRSPAVGIDYDTSHSQRSYIHLGGKEFISLADEGIWGGLMIRGIMEYALDTPLITNLKEINYINKDSISIEGKVTSDCTVNVYVNDKKVAELETKDRVFKEEIELLEDENTISVSGTIKGKETEPSVPIKVIKDKTPPKINITSPKEGEKTNKEVINIEGNIEEQNLDKVLINDQEIKLDAKGYFNKKLILNEGENIITITAIDLAGNETKVERKVYVSFKVPVITDIKPDKDLKLESGDKVEISFRSEDTGGKGYFKILLPINIANENESKIEMTEVEPGYYKAIWTIPENIEIKDGIVEIKFTNTFGNKIRKRAPGKITIE